MCLSIWGCLFPGCKNFSLELTFPGKYNENLFLGIFKKSVWLPIFIPRILFKEVGGYIDRPYDLLLKKMETVMLIFTTREHNSKMGIFMSLLSLLS